MRLNRKILFLLCLTIILSMGAVSAAESDDTMVSNSADTLQDIDDTNFECPEATFTSSTEGNWTSLKNKITAASSNDTIYLDGLTYITDKYDPIKISSNIKIVGGSQSNPNQMAVLDGNGLSGIFRIANGCNVVISNIIFQNGYSRDFGGAIYGQNTINLVLINSTFINNRAPSGGAVCIGALFNLTAVNCDFTRNFATSYGGAFFASSNFNLTLINSTLTGNEATNNGGAFFAYSNYYLNSTNSVFKNNCAPVGGIFYSTSNFNIGVDNSTFIENEGGILYASRGGTFSILNSRLMSNAGTDISLFTAIQKSKFRIVNTTFYNNGVTAANMFLIGNGSDLEIFNGTFINNSVVGRGGGLISVSPQSNVLINCSNFINNTANTYGAVIAAESPNSFSVYDSNFINSTSTEDAGASIFIKHCDQATIANCNFVNGQARFGGAVCSLSSTLVVKNSNFTNCRALFDGGAIYSMYQLLNVRDTNFINNTAINGGGVFIDSTPNVYLSNNNFTDNTAYNYGGAVFFNAYGTVSNTNNIFEDNAARVDNDIHYQSSYDYIIGSNNYTLIQGNFSTVTTLPSSYDSRKEGYVSPVVNQGNAGVCWAFGAISTLESCILKATNCSYDLSEANMKNLAEIFSAYGWKRESNTGNVHMAALGYLASWLGPISESDDRYSDYNVLSPALNSLIHIQNILFIEKPTNFIDNEAIKEAIMKYGAVGVSYYQDASNYNYNTHAYYCSNVYTINHGVSIVGWDDNYSRNNFKVTPPGDGAYIIKNSWGSDWGEDGYFYISYYDTSIFSSSAYNPTYTFILNETQRFNRNYQYDIMGISKVYNSGSTNVTMENIFTSTTDDFLAAVSTYFFDDCNYTVSIYVNDQLKLTQSGTSYIGYQTINLKEMIPLKTGDRFKVSFNILNDKAILIPLSTYSSAESSATRLTFPSGVSYFRTTGKYIDLYGAFYNTKAVACIKAFTTTLDTSIEISDNIDPHNVKVVANVLDQFGNPVSNGIVNFTVNGVSHYVNVNNGVATLTNLPNNLKKYDIRASLVKSDYYNGCEDGLELSNPRDTNLTISVDNVNGRGDLIFKFNFIDNETVGINSTLAVTFNNKSYTVKTTEGKGYLTVTNDIKPGDYTVNAVFDENEYYDSDSATLEFNKGKYDSQINITSVEIDEQEGIIRFTVNFNGTVTTRMDGMEVENSNGMIFLHNMGLGLHTITFSYGGNEWFKDADVAIELKVVKRTAIAGNNRTIYFPGKTSFAVNLADSDGNPLEGHTVTFELAGIRYNKTTDENGTAVLEINGLDIGEYPIAVAFEGSDIYNSSDASYAVSVKSSIESNDIVKIFQNGTHYTARFVDCDGNPLANVVVPVAIVGKVYNRVTDSNGVATLPIGLLPGNYAITVTAPNGEEKSNAIVVLPDTYALIAGDVVKVFKNDTHYRVKVLNANNEPVVGVKVAISIVGKTYYMTTDSDGVATLPIGLNPGSYGISAAYGSASVSNKVTVLAKVSEYRLVASDVVKVFKNDTHYRVKVLNANNEPVVGVKVAISIVGKTYYMTTDSDGVATLPIGLNPGSYGISAVYGSASVSNKVTVLAKVSEYRLVASDVVKVFKNDTHYRVKVLNANNEPVVGVKVAISIVGKTYYMTTDSDGVATLPIGLNPGSYGISAVYGSSSVSNKVTVLAKVSEYRLVASDVVKAFKNGTSYQVRVLDENNVPVVGVKVAISIVGKTYYMATDSDGVATLPIGLNPGSYDISASYGDATISNKVVVFRPIVSSDLSMTTSARKSFVVRIFDENGNAVSGAAVTFKIKTVSYDFTTNANGEASLPIGLAVGQYVISTVYKNHSVDNTIVVKN